MRSLLAILLLGCLPTIGAQADCSTFYPSEKGKTLIIDHYNHRDKKISTVKYQVEAIEQSFNKSTMTILMDMVNPRKDENLSSLKFQAICEDGQTFLDPTSFISPMLFKQYQNMEYSIENDAISIPNSLEVGQNLDDSEIIMSVSAGALNITTIILMTDRKVTLNERITTEAGTFDCYLIECTNVTKMNMGFNQTSTAKQWIAKEVGMVKQETRKSNGKLLSKSLLSKVY